MFKFDEDFLDIVGLSSMPEEEKGDFLQYAQDQLEVRIGEKMSASLNDAQIDEFERILDNDQATIAAWLNALGDYKNDPTYAKLKLNTGEPDDSEALLNEYVTAKWLDRNCPQYQEIIRDTLSELQDEIANQSEAILGSSATAPAM